MKVAHEIATPGPLTETLDVNKIRADFPILKAENPRQAVSVPRQRGYESKTAGRYRRIESLLQHGEFEYSSGSPFLERTGD